MPTVSVVIPTYNRTDILPRAIESVLAQTYDDLELVVVDDGSSEDVESVVDRYDDHRVRYIAHEENRGANAARNTGIEAADGDYLAFLDSDDEWHPRKLAAQLDRLESKSSEWVAAYCDYDVEVPGRTGTLQEAAARLLSSDQGRRHEGGDELIGETLADELHTGAGSTLLVRTDVVRDIDGFDPSLDWFQDPDFQIRVLQQGKLAHVPEPLVTRYYSGSPEAAAVLRADAEFLEKFADEVERFEAEGYDVRGAHSLVLAKYFLQEGRFGRGLAHLRDASVESRQVPGVVWAAGTGARRRRTVLPLAAFATLVVAYGVRSTVRNASR
jgi:glycosyltransferase involved in cell wall biosynthesis